MDSTARFRSRPFEIALIEILADADVPSLSEEHVQLLRRFDPLQQEALGYTDLNALLDSGIITRVRDLKQSLDSSFYHPGVLATIAPYNAVFGKRFDELVSRRGRRNKRICRSLAGTGRQYSGECGRSGCHRRPRGCSGRN